MCATKSVQRFCTVYFSRGLIKIWGYTNVGTILIISLNNKLNIVGQILLVLVAELYYRMACVTVNSRQSISRGKSTQGISCHRIWQMISVIVPKAFTRVRHCRKGCISYLSLTVYSRPTMFILFSFDGLRCCRSYTVLFTDVLCHLI